jgi:hypothetical protein
VIPDPVDIIYCEVCELPHRRGVAVCEECRHLLGTAPNWERIRAEVSGERNLALVGFGVTFGFGVLTMWFFGRAWLLIIVGLMAWSLTHARRWRAISKRLAKQSMPEPRR